MEERAINQKVLSRVDANRRTFVKRMLTGAAFAAPVLATFTMDALAPSSAQAQCLNCTLDTPEPSTWLLVGTGAIGLGVAAYRKGTRKKDETEASSDVDKQAPLD